MCVMEWAWRGYRRFELIQGRMQRCPIGYDELLERAILSRGVFWVAAVLWRDKALGIVGKATLIQKSSAISQTAKKSG